MRDIGRFFHCFNNALRSRIFFFAPAMISSPWLSRLEIRGSLSVVPFLDQEAHPHPYDSDRECSPLSLLPGKWHSVGQMHRI